MSSRREVCASVCESLAKPTIVYVYEFESHRAVTDHRDRRALRRRRARRTGLCAVKCDHGCELRGLTPLFEYTNAPGAHARIG